MKKAVFYLNVNLIRECLTFPLSYGMLDMAERAGEIDNYLNVYINNKTL